MKIYLAARFSRHDEMRGIRDVLATFGHEVTSRWIDLHGGDQLESAAHEVLNTDPTSVSHFGLHDIEDIQAADTVISFTSADGGGKGGRHVEHGLALGLGKRVIVCGPRENIFHTIPQIEHYPNWRALAIRFALDGHSGRDDELITVMGVTASRSKFLEAIQRRLDATSRTEDGVSHDG